MQFCWCLLLLGAAFHAYISTVHIDGFFSSFKRFIKSTGVLGLHEFWAIEKIVQAKFVLVKLCTSSFVKFRASEIFITCYPRNGVHLKISASEIRTSEIRASQGPPVYDLVSCLSILL